jgi:hypothetical protein
MSGAKMVSAQLSSLKDIRVREYCVRFLFGGFCTVAAGLIAERFGAAVGGLFLAFPAIFPAGASLLEAHEKRKMAKAGLDGTNQGRVAASVDSAGASIGCIGLIAFAAILWRTLPEHNAPGVIALATAAWLILSVTVWYARKSRWFRWRKTTE